MNYCRRGLEDNLLHRFPHLAPAWHLSLGTALHYHGDRDCFRHFRHALAHTATKAHAVAVADQLALALGTFGPAHVAPTLWGATAQLRLDKSVVRPPIWLEPYEQAVAHVTAQIGQSAFDAAWAVGTTLTLSDALNIALGDRPS